MFLAVTERGVLGSNPNSYYNWRSDFYQLSLESSYNGQSRPPRLSHDLPWPLGHGGRFARRGKPKIPTSSKVCVVVDALSVWESLELHVLLLSIYGHDALEVPVVLHRS